MAVAHDTEEIRRGDIWTADLRPGVGYEIAKKRPVLIISTDAVNTISPTVIVIPITSQQYTVIGPERVPVTKEESNLAKHSFALITQMRSIDKTRLIKKVHVLPVAKMKEIEAGIRIVLDLEKK